jgi:hypothetical protein
MTTLRWTLGLVVAIASTGYFALVVIGGGFRRSFGASDKSGIQVIVGIVVTGLVLASLVWPEKRLLLHIVAVLMVALCIGCAFLARETMFGATVGALYAVGWLTFYYRTVWAQAGQASGF